MRSISHYLGLLAVSKAHNAIFRESKAKLIFPLPPSLPDTALQLDFRTVFIAEAFYLLIFQDQLHTEEVEQLPDLKAIFLPWGMSPKAATECHKGLLIYQVTAWAAFMFIKTRQIPGCTTLCTMWCLMLCKPLKFLQSPPKKVTVVPAMETTELQYLERNALQLIQYFSAWLS